MRSGTRSRPVEYASISERGLAYLADGVFLFVGVLMGVLILFPVIGEAAELFALLGVATYYIYTEAAWGQTPGKMVFGIRVVQTDGTECGLVSSILRNLTKLLGGTLIATLVAILLIAGTDENQRLGDIFADTIVVRA